MRVPKSFKQVTVDQYQRIFPIWQKIEKETDSITIASDWCRIISILTDKTPADIEGLPIDQLKSIIKSLNWLVEGEIKTSKRKYLFIKGNLYRAKLDAKRFNTAQYVEIKTFLSRGNWVGEMHRILATIYSPLTLKGFKHDGETHEERANLFKQMPVAKVYQTVFFYSIQYKSLINRIREYGLKLAQQKNKEAQEDLMQIVKETLESIGDGTVQSMS